MSSAGQVTIGTLFWAGQAIRAEIMTRIINFEVKGDDTSYREAIHAAEYYMPAFFEIKRAEYARIHLVSDRDEYRYVAKCVRSALDDMAIPVSIPEWPDTDE